MQGDSTTEVLFQGLRAGTTAMLGFAQEWEEIAAIPHALRVGARRSSFILAERMRKLA